MSKKKSKIYHFYSCGYCTNFYSQVNSISQLTGDNWFAKTYFPNPALLNMRFYKNIQGWICNKKFFLKRQGSSERFSHVNKSWLTVYSIDTFGVDSLISLSDKFPFNIFVKSASVALWVGSLVMNSIHSFAMPCSASEVMMLGIFPRFFSQQRALQITS